MHSALPEPASALALGLEKTLYCPQKKGSRGAEKVFMPLKDNYNATKTKEMFFSILFL